MEGIFQNIAVKDAIEMVYEEKALLFDVRDEESYNQGHLPMSEWLNLEKVQKKEIILEKDIPVVLYCEHGSVSLMVARWLAKQGYTAYSIVGGYAFYQGYIEKQREEDSIWTMELK